MWSIHAWPLHGGPQLQACLTTARPLNVATATLQNEAAIYDFREEQCDWVADVAEAPTFRPSCEEFADPLGYIASIQAEAAKYGSPFSIPPYPARCCSPPPGLAQRPVCSNRIVRSAEHDAQSLCSSSSQAYARSYHQSEQRCQLVWYAATGRHA